MSTLRRSLRGLCRLAAYRIARRWPRYRYQPMDGPCVLSGSERVAFRRLASSWRSRSAWAPEPAYGRRPMQHPEEGHPHD